MRKNGRESENGERNEMRKIDGSKRDERMDVRMEIYRQRQNGSENWRME